MISIRKPSFVSGLTLLIIIATLFSGLFATPATAGSDLESEIERYVKGLRRKGVIRPDERTAWVAYDLTSGKKLATINENTQLQAASMIKPYLALAFFHQVRAGRIIYGSTSRRHMELMIQKSNNESTNWVMRQTGGPSATQALLKRHYPSLCRQLRLVEYIPKNGRTYRNMGSAGDYTRFLEALWKGKLPSSNEMLRLMALPGIDRLYTKARHVPAGTAVYNKTGSTAMCCGDMGILVARGRNRRAYPYVLVGIIESRRRQSAYSTWITNRANVIREVSNLTYLNMKRRYPI